MSERHAYTYSAYGLRIRSEVMLPDFVEIVISEDSTVDVEIFHTTIADKDIEGHFAAANTFDAPDCTVRVSESAMCFTYSKTGTILVSDGKTVIVNLHPDARDEDIVPYLAGYVLAVILHQRKYLVLHASVVMLNGVGVAFLGAKGQGKSTLAASLKVSGYRLISDDLLPIVFEGDRIFAIPGYPQIKLFEDSATAVGENPSRLTAVYPGTSKYSLKCRQFSDESIPLFAVYVLNIDKDITINHMSLPESFIEATKHTHVSYYLRESGSFEWHFEKCKMLVHSVPFFRLNRPHDFDQIYDVTESLKRHIDDVVIVQADTR